MTLARSRASVRSTVAAAALVALVTACQPGPSGSPGFGSREPQVSPSPSVPASPLASPSASVALAESPSPVPSLAPGWERNAVETGLGAPLTRVVWTGTRFLAVDVVDGTLLDAMDGRTWHQQPRLPGDGFAGLVAAGPEGLLAVGSVNAEGVIAIWHSRDGLDWSATPDSASLHGRGGAFITMAAVVAVGAGWLAVGGENLSCRPDTAAMQHADMTGVVRTPSGYVAVGEAAADPSRSDSAIRPAVWISPDGRTWTRSDRLPTVKAAKDADVVLDSVTATGSRVVAVGHVAPRAGGWADAFAWWSDGGTWSSVEIGRFYASQDVRVAAVPGGLLAMFGFGSDTTCSSAIWSAVDGSSWSCIGNDPAFAGSAVSDAAVSPDIEVLVGSGSDGAVIWTSAPH